MPRFQKSPGDLWLVTKIARTFGKMPHEVLALSPFELNLAALCVLSHDAEVARYTKRNGGGVFPVIDLGEML